jgi:coproporphyrinogen III oxidase
MRTDFSNWTRAVQNKICEITEELEEDKVFTEDNWERAEGGGGITRIIQEGKIFEKAGVNTSEVYGEITAGIRAQLNIVGERFFACGISLVMHPSNPMVPTVHANFRYFEVYNEHDVIIDSWFGGGVDLTPYYLFEEDAIHFHESLAQSCNRFGENWYKKFKQQCDDYFVNHHRNGERRGIGGIFYDHLRPSVEMTPTHLFEFSKSNAEAFIQAYFPIVARRHDLGFSQAQKLWQLHRRGRYVEFNLLHDRGTTFGLKSNGRTESILMSLPLEARFEYDYQSVPNSEEEKLQKILMAPIAWVK